MIQKDQQQELHEVFCGKEATLRKSSKNQAETNNKV